MGLALRRTVHAPFVLNSLRWSARYEADLQAGADNDAVSSWTDQSGYGRNATQGTGTRQPTLQTAELNGHNVVSFDGTDDFLTTAIPATNQPYTVVLVGTVRELPGGSAYALVHTGGGQMQMTTAPAYIWNAGTSLTDGAGTITPSVHVAVANGTASRLRINSTDVSGNAGTGATTTTAIAASAGGSLPSKLDAAFAGFIPAAVRGRSFIRLVRELRCRFEV